MPTRIGSPTIANSKNPNAPSPASTDASDTITFTGLPISTSSEPALPAYTVGISSRDGGCRVRIASTTTSGSSAATDPLRLISAVSAAHSSISATSSRAVPSPAAAATRWPTHVVSPLSSMASLTTKSVAMKITTGSPNPDSASSSSSRPVAHRARATPRATAPTGNRLTTNRCAG